MGLACARQSDLPLVVLRPFGIYGEGEGPHKLIPQMIRALLTGKPVKLTPGGQIRDYIHVTDFIAALELAAEVDLPAGRVYNVCSGEGITLRQLAEALRRVAEKPVTDLFEFGKLKYRKDEVMSLVGDPSRYRQATGLQPRNPPWQMDCGPPFSGPKTISGRVSVRSENLFRGVFAGRRVLITGHTGFKGSWLSAWLLELGAEICGYALAPQTEPNLFAILGLEKRCRHKVADIRAEESLRQTFEEFQPEFVFHLAAQPLCLNHTVILEAPMRPMSWAQ